MTSTLPGALPVIDPATVHKTVLPNGLTVLVRRDRSAPVVAIVTYVKAGYFDETDDVVGIAHVLEHMFFKGTERRGVGEISKETKAAGGYLNAHTIYDHTSYYTVLPSSSFAAGLDIQADAYANSMIAGDELAKELEVIIQEAKRKADSPSAVATETLFELLHDRHRMRRWRIGREAGLRQLDRDAMLRFYRNFYRPGTTILSIVGDVDPEEALRLVERTYGGLPAGEPARSPGPAEGDRAEFRYRELSGDIAQAQLTVGWRTPGTMHPDTPAIELAAATLGAGRASRLYRAVRERQLASSIAAYNYTPTELGVFVIHAESPAATVADAARGAWSQTRALREEGVGLHELERARRLLEARWIRRLETMEGQASHLAEWESLGDWTMSDMVLERLLTTTPEQVRDVARRYLAPDRAGMIVYRPASAPQVASDAGAMRALLEDPRPAPLPSTPARAATPAPAVVTRPALEQEEGGARVYRTPGGVPVLVKRKPDALVTHIGVYALGGAREETDAQSGMTTLLARTATKGTAHRTAQQIAEDGELLGGSVGATVGSEYFGWAISVPTKNAVAALELLGDVAQHATIPESALETERAVALSDVAMMRDDMFRYPMRLALEGAFAGHPYGRSPLGTEASLRRISAGEVRDWHRTRALEAPAVIAIVGDFEPDEAAAEVARHFPTLRMAPAAPAEAPTWPDRPVLAVESREKAQTALALLFPGPARRDEDRHTARILAGIASGLGGRFFDELRDRQSLAYTVHASASERALAGTFVSYIATGPEQEETARRGLLAEFAKLRESEVTAEELERAQVYAVGTHAIRQQNGGAVLGDLVDAWLVGEGLGELDRHDERVRAVTARGILALARRYFDEGRRVEGVVRGVGKVV